MSTVIHGFAGYFSSELYAISQAPSSASRDATIAYASSASSSTPSNDADVLMSIHPLTHSLDMCSWFPMFLPSRDAVVVRSGDFVDFIMWRCVDDQRGRVWYEWAFTVESNNVVSYQSAVHNVGGRSYWIGL
jgi:hypothetical protein